MLASVAIFAAVIGIAARAPLANLVSGVMIAFSQPVRLGDYISVDDVYGTVEEIRPHLHLHPHHDNRRVVIPNEVFASKAVSNYSKGSPGSMVEVSFAVPLRSTSRRCAPRRWKSRTSRAAAPEGAGNSVDASGPRRQRRDAAGRRLGGRTAGAARARQRPARRDPRADRPRRTPGQASGKEERAARIALAEASQVASDAASRRLRVQAIVAAVGSRILIFAVAFAAATLIGVNGTADQLALPVWSRGLHGALGHLLNPWAHWDGVWSSRSPSAATRTRVAAPPSSLSALAAALRRRPLRRQPGDHRHRHLPGLLRRSAWLLHRLVRADFDEAIASRTVVYLAIGPLSFFFQAVYTESLFLLLSLACFVFAREGRLRLAGVIGLLAVLTRSTGVLLLIPMTYYYYQRRDWKLRRTDSHVANLLMIPEGLLVWMTYLSLAFGNPFSFAGAQTQWARMLAAPNYTVGRAIAAAYEGVDRSSRQNTAPSR